MMANLDTRFGPESDWKGWAALTRAGAFAALREVTIKLTWFVLDISSESLVCSPVDWTKEHFPRLLKSTEIGFGFSVQCNSSF